MPVLRFQLPVSDVELARWRHVHNVIVPTAPLSPDDVRERAGRNRLALAYDGDVLVGNSTVRPPTPDAPRTATVIARVLPEFRGRGHGTAIHADALAHARSLGATVIETVVLATNTAGLAFAHRTGYTEFERYVLPGGTVPFITLRTDGWTPPARPGC